MIVRTGDRQLTRIYLESQRNYRKKLDMIKRSLASERPAQEFRDEIEVMGRINEEIQN